MQDHLIEEGADTFWFLTHWEFDFGLIGLADYEERYEVLQWLLKREPSTGRSPGDDPRGDLKRSADSPRAEEQVDRSEEDAGREKPPGEGTRQTDAVAQPSDEIYPLQLIPPGLRHRWCFTKNDADFYPSVPHGHLNDKNRPWPKLNPYTGRAFSTKDVEDPKYRLQQKELVSLWNNREFRRHALETIVWYQETYSYYDFPVSNPLRLPRRRRR